MTPQSIRPRQIVVTFLPKVLTYSRERCDRDRVKSTQSCQGPNEYEPHIYHSDSENKLSWVRKRFSLDITVNVIIKIVTKTIANQLKRYLPSPINETQSAFMPGRMITNNALITLENFYYSIKRKSGRKVYMELKLDMEKAYDRVEWTSPIPSLISKWGVSPWCHNSILLAGKLGSSFKPSKNLKYEDPLSPYLFIICAKHFTCLIDESKQRKQIKGIKVGSSSPSISHLFFFADDNIFFPKQMKSL